jgi:hypothetical protein
VTPPVARPPLADAAVRLRRPPGRPRTATPPPLSTPVVAVTARLVDVRGAALYLSLSLDGIRDLDARGVLTRVRLPGPNGGDLRRVLYDVRDLDRLIERMKDGA